MAVKDIAYFNSLFITGYVPTQQDYVDLVDTLTNLEVIVGASGTVPNNSQIGNGASLIEFATAQLRFQGILKLLSYAGTGNRLLEITSTGIVQVQVQPKLYSVQLSQAGTSDPSIDVAFINTTGVVPVISRSDIGTYTIGSSGLFGSRTRIDYTLLIYGNGSIGITLVDADTVEIKTYVGGSPSDDVLDKFNLTITIFP